MKIVQALLTGLVLAGVSGLTALAFRHPRAFARLFPYLIVGVSTIYLGLTVWHLAVHMTWVALIPFLDQGEFELAKLAKANLQLPYAWICGAFIAVLLLLWIDLKLPPFVKASEASRPKGGAKRVED